MYGKGVCGEGGHVWQRGACMAKGGHAWDTMRYRDTINEQAVGILLECILVKIVNARIHKKWRNSSCLVIHIVLQKDSKKFCKK